MAYEKQVWKNGEDGGTPITAERLNHIEQGIADKAEKGDPGKPGNPGKNGEDGIGIKNITRNGNTLVFQMTDDSTIEVDLPTDDGEGD